MVRKKYSPRMVQRSTAFFLFIIAFLLGAVLMWAYLAVAVMPQIVATTTNQVNAQRDALTLAAAKTITGSVARVGEKDFLIVASDGRGVVVSFDANTKFYRFTTTATGSQKEVLAASDIKPGSLVTVAATQPITSTASAYANEIIQN